MMEIYMQRFAEWSFETFKDATAMDSFKKLTNEELKELEEQLIVRNDKQQLKEEFADCMMCLIDSANRCNISPTELMYAFRDKLFKNIDRKWIKNSDNTYSHSTLSAVE